MNSSKIKEKILLTGASGFLGSYLLCELLNDGFNVKVLCRRPEFNLERFPHLKTPANIHKIEICEGDVLNIGSLTKAVADVDIVSLLLKLLN
jgi:uncharacterized protein YbjT (DUF2867 family)